MPPGFVVDRALPDDVPALPAIERASGALFAGVLPAVDVSQDVTSLDELHHARHAGLLWVARAPDGTPIGFALVELLAGQPHLEEMDVHPDHGRRGVGRALLGAVLGWAAAAGHRHVTLTTFQDIPWNAPFYASAGFQVWERAELPPALEAVVQDEASRGLDPARRVVMRFIVPSG
jgi:GNAT superfamily N-acetyltransferase